MRTMTILYNTHSMKKRRRNLRHSAPPAEVVLWQYLKSRQLEGYKFRRQFSIGGYVVDFYCPELRLVIEVDGPAHFINKEVLLYDKERQKYIESLNIKVLRFTNTDVYNNIDGVLESIFHRIKGITKNIE